MRNPKKPPSTRRILASVARANLAEVLEAVGEGKERILIDRRGKPPVALVSVDDLLQLELKEAREARALALSHVDATVRPGRRKRSSSRMAS